MSQRELRTYVAALKGYILAHPWALIIVVVGLVLITSDAGNRVGKAHTLICEYSLIALNMSSDEKDCQVVSILCETNHNKKRTTMIR